jgi:hypothetical protein
MNPRDEGRLLQKQLLVPPDTDTAVTGHCRHKQYQGPAEEPQTFRSLSIPFRSFRSLANPDNGNTTRGFFEQGMANWCEGRGGRSQTYRARFPALRQEVRTGKQSRQWDLARQHGRGIHAPACGCMREVKRARHAVYGFNGKRSCILRTIWKSHLPAIESFT